MSEEFTSPSLARIDAWLKSRRRRVIAALLGLALLVRVAAFYELDESPVFHSYTLAQMDMSFFDRWALTIRDVDPLGRKEIHPMHKWHEDIARRHLDANPQLLGRPFASLSKEAQVAAVKRVWSQWYRGTQFHQEPFYPYFVAAVYGCWGNGPPDTRWVYGLQMAGGVLMMWLLYLTTCRVFGDAVATLTVLIATGWGVLIHYEVALLRTSLLSLAGVAMLYAYQRAEARRDGAGFRYLFGLFGLGLLIGVATILKTTFLLFGAGLIAAVLWPNRRELGRFARRGTAVGAGILAALLPVWIRNDIVGAPLFGMTSVGPITFVATNVAGWVPEMAWSPDTNEAVANTIAQVMGQCGSSLFDAVRLSIATHASFFDWIGLLFEKLLFVMHWYEVSNNTNFYYTCHHSVTLDLLRHVVAALWLIPAGLVGLFLARKNRAGARAWMWYLLCTLAPMIVFYVLSRFRAPLIVGLMPFAAYAIASGVDRFASRRLGEGATLFGVMLLLVLLVARGFAGFDIHLVASSTHNAGIHSYYLPMVQRERQEGRFDRAVALWDDLFAKREAFVDELGPDRPIESDWEYWMIRNVYGPAYLFCLEDARNAGMREEARYYEAQKNRLQAQVEVWERRHGSGR